MGVRTPEHTVFAAQSIGNGAAEVIGSAVNIRGAGKITVFVTDAGSGGALTMKNFIDPDPTASAPTAVSGLHEALPAVTAIVDGATTCYDVPATGEWLLLEGQHATADVNATVEVVVIFETGAGEY